jgi:membrane-associated PAP2 superfamily phosphatase
MGFRLMAHAAPEPTTHAAISVAEDFGVVALLALAYAYPWIALPVMFGVIAGILAFLPFLVRVARFLLAGLFGRVASWFSVEPTAEVPGAVRVFARRVPGAPRLVSGWMRVETGAFVFRRWGRTRELAVGTLEPGVEWGFVYNVARTSNGATFYMTKEWCACVQGNVLSGSGRST